MTPFDPITLGPLQLQGRIFKTATSETRASPEGDMTLSLLDFYRPIAAAGTPLIVTGAVYISAAGQAAPRQLGADHDGRIRGLRMLTDLVHSHGGRIVAQLAHAGRQVLPHAVGLTQALSASAVREPTLGTLPAAMSRADIAQTVRDFGAAARRCREAGFDGVQLQAAHGYLLGQFITPHTNRRDDDYGAQTARRRSQLLREVTDAVREALGDRAALLLKINGEDALLFGRGLATDALIEVASAVQHAVDAFEVSVGHYASLFPGYRGRFGSFYEDLLARGIGSELAWPRRTFLRLVRPLLAWYCDRRWPHQEGFNLDFARRFKLALDRPIISVGGFQSLAAIEAAIGSGACDAVAIGRAMIADPALVRNLRDGRSGPVCVRCNRCYAVAGKLPAACYSPELARLQR
jgi:2,4-dienoyl-CoA reductase-like NADH-dependent reductase (Old Yellow Enzyme family)